MKYPVKRHEVVQPLDPSYRIIPLTQGQNAIVDAADYEQVSEFNWHAHWNKNTNSFYARMWGQGRIMMHKFILGYGKGKQGDHRNHDTLDNRRHNLSECTAVQNSQHRRLRSDSSTGFKGVSKRPTGRWRAVICVNKKRIHLGGFSTPELASKAYQQAALEYFGTYKV